jgi:hypothetical protein
MREVNFTHLGLSTLFGRFVELKKAIRKRNRVSISANNCGYVVGWIISLITFWQYLLKHGNSIVSRNYKTALGKQIRINTTQ